MNFCLTFKCAFFFFLSASSFLSFSFFFSLYLFYHIFCFISTCGVKTIVYLLLSPSSISNEIYPLKNFRPLINLRD
uniref:Uncharacterized protein n=1 Tax=Octopus bimaculoides TaxID=37653 RepID=A0A0L8IB00_OCTBM